MVNLERKSAGQLRAESGGQYQRKMQKLYGQYFEKFLPIINYYNHFKYL